MFCMSLGGLWGLEDFRGGPWVRLGVPGGPGAVLGGKGTYLGNPETLGRCLGNDI